MPVNVCSLSWSWADVGVVVAVRTGGVSLYLVAIFLGGQRDTASVLGLPHRPHFYRLPHSAKHILPFPELSCRLCERTLRPQLI